MFSFRETMGASQMDEQDERVDALYALPLGDFIAGRKRLSGELKKAGDTGGARTVTALAKPSVSAWITNQIVRRAPQELAKLLSATDSLAVAQRAIGRPGQQPQDFQAALAEQRRAVAALSDMARTVLTETGQKAGDAVMDRVEKNLRWGPISGAARPLFERGRLVEDVPPPGFGALAGAEPGPALAAQHGGKQAPRHAGTAHGASPAEKPPPAQGRGVGRTKTERARDERQRARAAAQEERQRQRRRVAAQAELRQAQAETATARAAVERGEKARAKAAGRVTEAEKALATARAALEAADQELDEARAALAGRQATQGELDGRLTDLEKESTE